MRLKGKDEEFENVERRDLEEILCAFILAVKKGRPGGEYEPTRLRSIVSSGSSSSSSSSSKLLFKQGSPFSSKAGLHMGPVS